MPADPDDPTADSVEGSDPLALARDIADAYRGTGAPAARRRTRPRARPRRPQREDAVRVGDALGEVIRDHGWDERLSVQRLFTDWTALVGAEIAAHSRVESFADGVAEIRTDSTAWARQLQLLAPSIVRRLNVELGHGTVTLIEVRGPQAPSWTKGKRSLRDARGPRDTYG